MTTDDEAALRIGEELEQDMIDGKVLRNDTLYSTAWMLEFARRLLAERERAEPVAWRDLNLNEIVRYKLTSKGLTIHWQIWDSYRLPSSKYSVPKIDENGWSETQLWCLFQDYGPHISLGCDPCIETTIQVKVAAPAAPSQDALDGAGYKFLYEELLMAVARKWPNETRHQTALRYILEREAGGNQPAGQAALRGKEEDHG